ncbi:MAG: class I SAM-dependent methyltransferase [Planctomycetota bacterium]
MQIDRTEQIGNVLLKRIQTKRLEAPIYSDGSVEDELYQGFKSGHDYATTTENKKFASWAHEYHLSPLRHNLLKWYPFDSNGSVLEVGAGCGALTGLLCSRLKNVTALEYSYRRALVTAQRHSKQSNLEVIVGGLQDFECEEQFDYVIVIGVLEYAAQFHEGKNPYKSFLVKLRKLLKTDGAVILAIENKIGLKYITGAPEDHTGLVFESIYDYASTSKIRTFCKKQLTEVINSAGFFNLQWYYPLPDYKLPQIILSDEMPPDNESDRVWALLPCKTSSKPRKEILSEAQLGKAIAEAGLFGEFANSFLVTCRTKTSSGESACLRFDGAKRYRRPEFRTEIMVCREDKQKFLIKSPAAEIAKPFIELMAKRERDNVDYLKEHLEVLCGTFEEHRLKYEFLPYQSLEQIIASQLREGSCDEADATLKQYVDKLHALSTIHTCPSEFLAKIAQEPPDNDGVKVDCLIRGLIDLTPRNILVAGNKWIVVDNEWSFDFPIPVVFVLFRAILELVVGFQDEIRKTTRETRPAIGLLSWGLRTYYYPTVWSKYISDTHINFAQMLRWEKGFQRYITGFKGKAVGYIKINNPRIKYSLSTRYLRSNTRVQNMINFAKKLPGARRFRYVLERLMLCLQKQ